MKSHKTESGAPLLATSNILINHQRVLSAATKNMKRICHLAKILR